MSISTRIGIIDIGSNSIRLVVYEQTSEAAHRVISEYKESARLSERIGTDGMLHQGDIRSIIPILTHFSQLCKNHEVRALRAVATAAIRNAANSAEIKELLEQETGLTIEVLSGSEEARFGFLGVINTIDMKDGIIVDIGGGSTEVTLFLNRKLKHSISFPFGAVNTTRQFSKNGTISEAGLADLRQMVEQALATQPWISEASGLPLIGLGGTVRNLAKMSQKRLRYSLQLAHNYVLYNEELEYYIKLLSSMPVEKRKKVEGLSKDRADIILPGLTILHTLFQTARSSACIVSGSGLRDGLLYETIHPSQPELEDVLESSIQNLLWLHPNASIPHVRQVDKLAMLLYTALEGHLGLDSRHREYLHAACLLYRIGVSVSYYQYSKHTQYLIAQARIDGFSHREILLISLVASYKTRSRNHQMMLLHKDILADSDELAIIQLGVLMQMAIAMDRSETQLVKEMKAVIQDNSLQLSLICSDQPLLELREAESLKKEFLKLWKLKLHLQTEAASTN
ncbi:exopolyphosphatase [Paenibacillus eucommiae]|uniref:Chaperone protein DnaK n=1 Tax=Paenibacillus eucommiae TaxID=1355755 RepID=A0ABS4IPK2_9BACL|nr:exopolyphosphatase [Paenibacillus eucommiae]MBP1989490.1 exopolyphosphatase/guanosine-5'-triphosphate,3'-diphosphate pyrophosphatase [Paenibacillus eucommiae]